MTKFRLNLVYSGVDLDDDEIFERLAELPHVLWRTQGGHAFARATVEANSALQAADLVARQIAEQVPSARPIRLDEDLVAIPDIAARIGMTREAVRNWANGTRQANFPPPRGTVGEGIKVWAWSEVNTWLRRNLNVGDQVEFPRQRDIAAINALFDRYRHAAPAAAAISWSVAETASLRFSLKPGGEPPWTHREGEPALAHVGSRSHAA